KAPGPGSYTPSDPYQNTQANSFGSANRMQERKVEQSPEPGSYSLPGTMEHRSVVMAGKYEGKLGTEIRPGPGAYTANFSQVYRGQTNITMDSKASRLEELRESGNPGPGQYPMLKELGGNIITKGSASFSMYGRRKPPRSDEGPGPSYVNYSQFGKTS
ncbi:unnamed protein product, partial [Polarella glacialis]